MTRAIFALVAVALLASPARAGTDVSGRYTIKKGVMPDKKKYGGEVEITKDENENYTVTWIGPDGGALYTGTGWIVGKDFVVAFGPAGVAPGNLDFDGRTLDGLPAMQGNVKGMDAGDPLPYFVAGASKKSKWKAGSWGLMDDQNNEIGTLDIAKQGKAFALTWKLGDREVHGVGLTSGKKLLVAAFAGDGDFGVVVYKIKKGGNGLDGSWAQWGVPKLGVENLVRQ